MTENSEICANCGHSRSLHICDIGGCTHSKIDRGKFGNAKITSVDDWDCDCRKFISPKKQDAFLVQGELKEIWNNKKDDEVWNKQKQDGCGKEVKEFLFCGDWIPTTNGNRERILCPSCQKLKDSQSENTNHKVSGLLYGENQNSRSGLPIQNSSCDDTQIQTISSLIEKTKKEIEFWEERIEEIKKNIKPELMVGKSTLMNYNIVLSELRIKLQAYEECAEIIEDLIKLRKGSLNWNVRDYEEIFSINDLNSILGEKK